MRPFQEFRLWAHRAPAGERAATGVVALVVMALLVSLMAPSGKDMSAERDLSALGHRGVQRDTTDTTDVGSGDDVELTGSEVGGETRTGGTGATISGRTGTSGSGTPIGSSQDGGPAGCISPPGKARGITDKEVKVIVVLTEIFGPAANDQFDVPTPEEARADFEAAINGINKEGGVACRKLVAQYVNANPIVEESMMRQCRDFAEADVFAIVDTGSMATRPAVLSCLGQNKMPYFGAFYITEALRQQFYPYIYSFYTKELLYKDTAFALRDVGFFDAAKGFKKLGFVYRDCEKEAITAFRKWIKEAGVPDALVVPYNLNCPAVFASETDMAQAINTFQRQGVTHVIPANAQGDIARLTAHAEQQEFRPKWGVPDEALLSIATGSRAPDPKNFANAIAVTLARDGEQDTPGMTPTAGTQRCNAYRKVAGLPPVYDVPANAGHACSQLWMLQGALNNAPELSVTAIQVGLQRTKSIDYSFPQGVNDFTAARVTTGGQFYRVAQFTPDCTCWRVIQRDFKRGFQ
ncbi:MAG TPA: ABC transporter substrate-binding protein [Acidimicrobiales bacterium]|nr:ABC transporter substrate-binding protein [Acidimicrobiales bacterium]